MQSSGSSTSRNNKEKKKNCEKLLPKSESSNFGVDREFVVFAESICVLGVLLMRRGWQFGVLEIVRTMIYI